MRLNHFHLLVRDFMLKDFLKLIAIRNWRGYPKDLTTCIRRSRKVTIVQKLNSITIIGCVTTVHYAYISNASHWNPHGNRFEANTSITKKIPGLVVGMPSRG